MASDFSLEERLILTVDDDEFRCGWITSSMNVSL